MNGPWRVRRILIVGLAIAGCLLAGFYFHVVLHTDIVCTHLVYIPIVLAGMWWGKRSVYVALFLGGVVLLLHLFNLAAGPVWADAARTLVFIGVAFCVGTLSEKVMAGQEALRHSEQKYRLIVNKSLAGMFVYRDERFLFANPRLCEMLGRGPETLIGRSIWDIFDPEDQPRVRGLVEKRKAEGFSDLHYECRLVRGDGQRIWADVASSAADYEGAPSVLVNVYDITQSKEAERKRQELSELARKQEEQLVHSTRLAELGELAAGVAHELNQPLTGIRNFARNAFYMIENNVGGPSEIKDNLRLISEQVDRASKIINQMRELTRQTERHMARVDINGVIRETVEFLHPQLRLSGVETALDLQEDLPEIMGDRIRLEQVLLNLLTNARQAMDLTEHRRLTVKSYLAEGEALPVRVVVSDTGMGFSPDVAKRLFTPFFSTKKGGHGTGLGLSISLRIVKDHQGTIEASGAPGKGATFTIRLPIGREEDCSEGLIGE